MQNDILFDNIYVGHSEADAEKLQKETFDVKRKIELQEEANEKPKEPERPKSPSDLKFLDDPVKFVAEKVELFLAIAKRDPVEAVRFLPEVAGGIAAVAITILALILGLFGGAAAVAPSSEQVKATADKAKAKAGEVADAAAQKKDEVAAAIASGTEAAQEEVKKRTTRSSAAQS